MPGELSLLDFFWLCIAAFGIGVSKSGFAGVSLLNVVIFAKVFGARASTGVLLPLLIVGDIGSVIAFGSKARWQQFLKLLPPALIGVLIGTLMMRWLNEVAFKPIVGVIILLLALLQIYRLTKPNSFNQLPHSHLFAWSLGLLAGVTTMLANAAGPIIAIYLLAVALPKLELVGTSAWLFLTINLCKVPFSYLALDLINAQSLWINLMLTPVVPLGLAVGSWAVHRINQRLFDILLLSFTVVAAVRMIAGS